MCWDFNFASSIMKRMAVHDSNENYKIEKFHNRIKTVGLKIPHKSGFLLVGAV